MLMENKLAAKAKLASLLYQVKAMKKQMSEIKGLQEKFTFASLMPVSKKISPPCQQNDENKENSQNALNKANITSRNSLKHFKQMKQSMKSFPKTAFIVDETMEELKNKNDQIKDLKAGLIMQLTQIKSMEKKSESMRRTNQKIKEYNSHQKRNYRQSVSKDKQNINNQTQKSRGTQNCDKTIDSFILDSKISLSPVNLEPTPKTLKCSKGHEYYEGFVNNQGLPHGNGRLDVCCGAIPTELGCESLKDSVFYQGQFKDGKFHGFGTLSYKGGVKYVGQFREGRRHGKGSMYCNGKAEVANWQNDTFISIM